MFGKLRVWGITFAAIIAMALAFTSPIGAFAAGSGKGMIRDVDQELTSQWKSRLADLGTIQFMDKRMGKWAGDWLDKKRTYYRIHKERWILNTAHSLMQQAEVVATNHSGFNAKGEVINRKQAIESLQSLTLDLHNLHLLLRASSLRSHKQH